MKTRDEFVRKFRFHITGMALCGAVSETKDGPLVKASKAYEIPGEVDRLLASMYDWLNEQPPPPRQTNLSDTQVPTKNGQPAGAVKR